MTPLILYCFILSALLIRSTRTSHRSHLRSLAVIRRYRRRRDELCAMLDATCEEILEESARADALNEELRAYRAEDDHKLAVRAAVEKSMRERFSS